MFFPARTEKSVRQFLKDITLPLCVPKCNQSVVLISTMHNEGTIDEVTKKPHIILDYILEKDGD